MNNYLKKLLSMLMVLTVVFALFIPAFASFETATVVEMDKVYSDSIDSNDKEDYFKFTTTQYGRVRFYVTTGMERYTLSVHDASGKEVAKFIRTASTIASDSVPDCALDAGTYYLKVTGNGYTGLIPSAGSYDFRMTFTAEVKGQSDVDNDKNNELKYAKEVKIDATSAGKILNDDENDFYKLTVNSAGTVTVKFTSKMEYYCLYLLNAGGNAIWSTENNQWDASKKSRTDNYTFELSAGTYYFKVNSLKGSKFPQYLTKAKGSYEFDVNFKSANSTSVEPNDSFVNPNKIALDKKVVGHLSMTDGKDYYEITVANKIDAMIAFVSYMPSYNIRVLDADNKEVWSSKNNALAEKTTNRKDVHELSLAQGRYFIVVDGGTGKYDFQISEEVSVAKVKTVKYERTVTTLRLYWSKVTGADGYEVFKYDEDKKEFVKIGSTTSKRSLKLKKLKGGTTYEFKVRAYKKLNGCIVYGNFSEERTATITPARATISSVKAGKKSATVNWKKVNGASGYRVFYTTDKDFDYVSKKIVKDPKATSKTIKKLKSGKKYYFKVRAYKTFNGKNVYGNLSKIKSVKVK